MSSFVETIYSVLYAITLKYLAVTDLDPFVELLVQCSRSQVMTRNL